MYLGLLLTFVRLLGLVSKDVRGVVQHILVWCIEKSVFLLLFIVDFIETLGRFLL